MNIKKTVKHITGISTPFVGISWDLSNTEKEIIRNLFIFLENRRVLFNPYELEDPRWVVKSIIQIRAYLTKVLQQLDDSSNLNNYIKPMRASCRKFLDKHSKPKFNGFIERAEIFAGLGEVRAMFGSYLKDLCKRFNIDVEKDLASIFPIEE
jgi:hypothetical protein